MGYIKEKVYTAKSRNAILLRTAKLKDARQLRDLVYNISKERIYSLVEPEEFSETIRSNRARVKRYKESPGKLYIVAEHKKKIIGLVQFNNFDFKKCRHNGLFTIFISKLWRDKGIGKMMIREMLDWTKANPVIEKVSLNVFSNNPRAIALYRKMGFKQEGLCKRDMKISNKYVNSVLMFKWVGQ